jgi:hypothetical protein
MSLNYTTYVNQLANLMVQGSTDPNFVTFLPGCIDYAEQRMYRELDLQTTRVADTSTTVSSGVRNFTLPTTTPNGNFVVVEQINILTPVTATSSNGTRNPLTLVTKEYLDFAWPSAATNTGVPLFMAPLNQTTFIFGPAPDAAYTAEVVGTIRPLPLSASNSSTFLTQSLPDVFMAASMVFASAYQRDFGPATDDPAKGSTWESQYKILMASANIEELRKRFMGPAWQPMQVSPVASPPRV